MRCKVYISIIIMMLCSTTAWAEVVVIMRKEAQPTGNYVRICDIARVDGTSAQAREVAMTIIGPSPSNGETHEISRWDIEHRLNEMGLQARVTFSGNEVVRVLGKGAARRAVPSYEAARPLQELPGRSVIGGGGDAGYDNGMGVRFGAGNDDGFRSSKVIKPEPKTFESKRSQEADEAMLFSAMSKDAKNRVGQVIAHYFADKYRSGDSGRSDVEVEAKVVGASANIPYSARDIRVQEAVDGRVPGRAKLLVKVRDDENGPEREVVVQADTDVYAQALVATRNLSRGDSLDKGDVKVARVRMESGKSYLPPRPKVVAGREAKRSIKPGEVLLSTDATPSEAVKRGQLVLVDTHGKGWRFQAKAKAQGSGTVGDIITVEDIETRTKFPARITDRGTVAVVVNKDEIIFERK